MAGGVGLEPTGAMRAALTVRCLAIRRTRQDECGLGWQDRTADLLRPRQARYQAALIPETWCPQSDSNGRLRAFNAALIPLNYRGERWHRCEDLNPDERFWRPPSCR